MLDEVDLGKWRGQGKTLAEILVEDPGWYFWSCSVGVFDRYDNLASQAQLLERRAQSISIPAGFERYDCVHLWFNGRRFSHLEFGTSGRMSDAPGLVVTRPYLDLSLAWRADGYDKKGGAALVEEFRSIWFAGKPFTRKRLHAFFSDEDNFVGER